MRPTGGHDLRLDISGANAGAFRILLAIAFGLLGFAVGAAEAYQHLF